MNFNYLGRAWLGVGCDHELRRWERNMCDHGVIFEYMGAFESQCKLSSTSFPLAFAKLPQFNYSTTTTVVPHKWQTQS